MRFFAGWAIIGIALGAWPQIDRSHNYSGTRWDTEGNQWHMSSVATYLRDYSKQVGRYPTSSEGLLEFSRWLAKHKQTRNYGPYALREAATEAGVVSKWREPLVYENRRGLPATLFADSGATRDPERRYSVRVDPDIYIWSVAAEGAWRKHQAMRTKLWAVGCALLALVPVGTGAKGRVCVPETNAPQDRSWAGVHRRRTGCRVRQLDHCDDIRGHKNLLRTRVLPLPRSEHQKRIHSPRQEVRGSRHHQPFRRGQAAEGREQRQILARRTLIGTANTSSAGHSQPPAPLSLHRGR
jgi:hypothetical protein